MGSSGGEGKFLQKQTKGTKWDGNHGIRGNPENGNSASGNLWKYWKSLGFLGKMDGNFLSGAFEDGNAVLQVWRLNQKSCKFQK